MYSAVGRAELKVVVRHPLLILYALRGRSTLTGKLVEIELNKVRAIWGQTRVQMLDEVQEASARARLYHNTAWLYLLVRQTNPSVIVETGVHAGASSAFVLQAVKDNGSGHLFSIDLPKAVYQTGRTKDLRIQKDTLPRRKESGFAVPARLRGKWDLRLGDAEKVLPILMDSLPKVDIFFHDSRHTYEHMMFELDTAYPHVTTRGIMACDDASWNRAFDDFCKRHTLKPVYVESAVNAVKK